MEFEMQVNKKISSAKELVTKVVESIKANQDKQVFEALSKELVQNLYGIKQLIKEVDELKPKSYFILEKISRYEEKISRQNMILSRLKKYDYI